MRGETRGSGCPSRFNGAALNRGRKGYLIVDLDALTRASTGPPSIEGGKKPVDLGRHPVGVLQRGRPQSRAERRSPCWRQRPRPRGFNGAALNRGRKGLARRATRRHGRSSASTGPPSIEGGKKQLNNEYVARQQVRASTGPPSIEGGKSRRAPAWAAAGRSLQRGRPQSRAESTWVRCHKSATGPDASTGPPSIEGGKLVWPVGQGSSVGVLQRGRPQSRAERRVELLQERLKAASTGPPSIEGGKADPSTSLQGDAMLLQRGRPQSRAESRTPVQLRPARVSTASTGPPSIEGGKDRARVPVAGAGVLASTGPPSIEGGKQPAHRVCLRPLRFASTGPPSIEGGKDSPFCAATSASAGRFNGAALNRGRKVGGHGSACT
ncbi:Periplasmic thiol disulfide interchange protein DsbA [Enhygromyxa salina]|uniref:Periplasmic thiol disulfide interchange protein DsbA n=1 Tax=Enhygromyxa salina TaxID=215803 RepID=A0A0C2A6C9_9BACT|nr:Periplasmic thiol disulfide interchange protein DsbA [Enhygromyxa salina]